MPLASALAALLLASAVSAVRWAKRGSSGTQLVASAMMLVLGMFAPGVQPPEQGIEQVREDKGKKGSESGDPPAV
jgi:hypothetical protein